MAVKKKTRKAPAPAPRKRMNWKAEAIRMQRQAADEASKVVRQLVQQHRLELDALKGRIFHLTAEQSPWVRQNNAIRKVAERFIGRDMPWREARAAMKEIAAILCIGVS